MNNQPTPLSAVMYKGSYVSFDTFGGNTRSPKESVAYVAFALPLGKNSWQSCTAWFNSVELAQKAYDHNVKKLSIMCHPVTVKVNGKWQRLN